MTMDPVKSVYHETPGAPSGHHHNMAAAAALSCARAAAARGAGGRAQGEQRNGVPNWHQKEKGYFQRFFFQVMNCKNEL